MKFRHTVFSLTAGLLICSLSLGDTAYAGTLGAGSGTLSGIESLENETTQEAVLQQAGVSFDITTTDIYEEHPSIISLEERLTATDDLYKDIAISDVDNYVNIRSEANSTSEILGKIYTNSVAHIQETVETDDGTWYKIKSGSVTGYIKAEYVLTGEEAEAVAKQVGTVQATVTVESLRLRDQPSLEGNTITVLSGDEAYDVVSETGDFVRLSVDGEIEGYVMKDYVEISVNYNEAISIEEEQAELARQAALEAARKAAEEAARQESIAASKAAASKAASKAAAKKSTTKATTTAAATQSTTKASSTPGSSAGSVSSLREAICSYAESFAGNLRYVYGGNSLSSGTDCSGFVKLIFAEYGISLPRTSDSQGYTGKSVSASEMRPGDIVYYGGHVAIYIGDGLVVHCSSANSVPNTKISTWNYRTVLSIRNVLGD